ncbi:hypothetical protein D3C81_2120680 [compost metagenome]
MIDQEGALSLGFHAFGNHRKAQDLAQAHDRAGDGGIVGIDQHIPDEGLVDLQLIQRQTLQIGQ